MNSNPLNFKKHATLGNEVNTMEEFEERFYKDSYQKEIEAEVVSCIEEKGRYAIVLSDTVFYPEGGGQPADTGTLNDKEVIDVQRVKGVVTHYLKEPLAVGEKVRGVIDWQHRFDLMQNHSGEHILSGIIHKHFGYENVGYRMKEDVIEIDLSGPLTVEDILMVEEEVNQVIFDNVEIQVSYPSREELNKIEYRSKKELNGQVRLIIIPEADICACCGTHVKRTGEIGMVKILSSIGHKGGTRLELVCGKRAYKDYVSKQDQNTKIMHLLSLKPNEIADGVKKLQEEHVDLIRKYNTMVEKSLYEKADAVAEGKDLVIDFEEDLDRTILIHFANYLLHERKAGIVAVLNYHNGAYNYIILSETLNLRNIKKDLNQKLNGKGGGKPDMIQGSFSTTKENIEETLKEILK